MAVVEQRNYFKVGDCVNLFGPNNVEVNFTIEKIIDSDGNNKDIANHPKEVLKINVPIEVSKDFIIRIKV